MRTLLQLVLVLTGALVIYGAAIAPRLRRDVALLAGAAVAP